MSLEEAMARKAARVENLKAECAAIFAQSKNISFEIGCGKGHWLSSYAAANPDKLCVGIDLISERVRDSIRRAKNKNASNAHFIKAEASEFLDAMPSDVRLENIFVFFPDPWPKEKHHKRRLMQSSFLDYIRQFCVAARTKLYFRTDFREYFDWTVEAVKTNDNWELSQESELPIEEVSQFQRILPEFSTLIAVAK